MQGTPIDRPDLALFSQAALIAANLPPIYENPDITTVFLDPLRLMPEAIITVRNLSPTTAAANALVHLSTSPFGIGTRQELRATRLVSVGPSSQVLIAFPLPHAVLSGDPRVGIHIDIELPVDANPIDNSGSQMFDGGSTSLSGRNFDITFPVVNDGSVGRRIDLAVLQGDLIASVAPSTHLFAPFEQIVAKLHIEVPPFISGTPAAPAFRAVTVTGRSADGGEVIGGLTRLLRIDN